MDRIKVEQLFLIIGEQQVQIRVLSAQIDALRAELEYKQDPPKEEQ